MSETNESQPPEVALKRLPGFLRGHERYAGRVKHPGTRARDLAAKMGADPVAFLVKLLVSDVYQQTVINDDGSRSKKDVIVSLETRLDAARILMGYCYPKLSTTAITGADGGPVRTASLDVAKLLQDPVALKHANALALWMVDQGSNSKPPAIPYDTPPEPPKRW